MSGPCIRCGAEGTHVVFETSGGSVTGPAGAPGSGPLTGRLYACDEHAGDGYYPPRRGTPSSPMCCCPSAC